jgi:hypothetical protein
VPKAAKYDPVLRDYVKEYLTYRDFRDMAFAWQKKSRQKTIIHPTESFPLFLTGHSTKINAKSAQLSFVVSNFGSLLRRPGKGSRKMWT